MKKIALILWALICPQIALAQNTVLTQPLGASSQNNRSSTVAVTNTFQTVFTASTGSNRGRVGCTIQNNSTTNPMYVFFGPLASATVATSVKVAPGTNGGGVVYCNQGGIVWKGEVNITGTATDVYYAAEQ